MILLISPPASGKTTLMKELLHKGLKVVFVAPLNAILLELQDRVISWGFSPCLYQSQEDLNSIFYTQSCDILLLIPERLTRLLSNQNAIKSDIIFVLDEFHLFHYWGESFRPKIWDGLVNLFHFSPQILALTATLEQNLLVTLKNKFKVLCENIDTIDLGNRTLQKYPKKTYSLPFKFLHQGCILISLLRKQRVLVFCRSRAEVKRLHDFFTILGFKSLSCVGGETRKFRSLLTSMPSVQIIIATTALSHGVNLPSVQKIFITYHEENTDIYFQMVGRGGRNGEDFNLFVLGSRFKSLIEPDRVNSYGKKDRRADSQKKWLWR